MCTDIMIESTETWDQQSPELSNYAIQYWYEHLKELDADKASQETIVIVVTLLYKITQNTNNIAMLFAKLGRHEDIYPERAENAPTAWFDTLLIWADKAKSIPGEFLNTEVKSWALTVDKDNVLLPLAQGHVRNWLDASSQWWIPENFRFVKASLSLVSCHDFPHRNYYLTTTGGSLCSRRGGATQKHTYSHGTI
jgi:hypothetical protein